MTQKPIFYCAHNGYEVQVCGGARILILQQHGLGFLRRARTISNNTRLVLKPLIDKISTSYAVIAPATRTLKP